MKAIDPNPIKWALKTTEGFLREIIANQDRDSLQHIVANTQNWRLCFDLLPDMVELALRREFTDKKLGRPRKENAQVYFDAIACLASTKKTKRTYTAQWSLVMGGVNRPTKPKFTPAQALSYITSDHQSTIRERRIARNKFKIRT